MPCALKPESRYVAATNRPCSSCELTSGRVRSVTTRKPEDQRAVSRKPQPHGSLAAVRPGAKPGDCRRVSGASPPPAACDCRRYAGHTQLISRSGKNCRCRSRKPTPTSNHKRSPKPCRRPCSLVLEIAILGQATAAPEEASLVISWSRDDENVIPLAQNGDGFFVRTATISAAQTWRLLPELHFADGTVINAARQKADIRINLRRDEAPVVGLRGVTRLEAVTPAATLH